MIRQERVTGAGGRPRTVWVHDGIQCWHGSYKQAAACGNNPDNAPKPIHWMTGSSTVACGATMRMPGREGWDLGTATTDPTAVTCPNCLPDYSGMPYRRGAPRYVRPVGMVDR